jgi:hypothetical protein
MPEFRRFRILAVDFEVPLPLFLVFGRLTGPWNARMVMPSARPVTPEIVCDRH